MEYNYLLEFVDKIKVNDKTLKNNDDLILLLNNDVKSYELDSEDSINLIYYDNIPIDKIEDLDSKAVDLDLKNVTHLTFYYGFNQPIEDLDLKNVTHLTFGKYSYKNI